MAFAIPLAIYNASTTAIDHVKDKIEGDLNFDFDEDFDDSDFTFDEDSLKGEFFPKFQCSL